MKCNKCDNSSTLTLRKKDLYCDTCFLTNTNHKFRACIGKNKILSKNEKVMVCLSGGPGSIVLLDLIHHGISMDIHKKLRITPYFLHLSDGDDNIPDTIDELCQKYGFNLYISHISNYLQKDLTLSSPESNNYKEEFQTIMRSMPPTANNDFNNKVKRSLFIRYAQLMDCKYVFTAETSSTLAVNLLSNLAIGRGSQVENDIGFIDSRDHNVKILRPMKDITEEELNHYIRLKGLTPASCKNPRPYSLQTAIGSFVNDLQENFQSTISAICRTADKIGAGEDNIDLNKCAMCESRLSTINNNLSALEATIISRTVSHGHNPHENPDSEDSLFPYINESLCYSCSRNFSEMNISSPLLLSILQ